MTNIYKLLFYTGVLYTIVSFLLGNLFDFVDIDGDIDISGEMPWFTVSPLKPIVIVAFVTVFGGMGIIGELKNWSTIGNICIALFSGLLVAGILYKFVVVPLYKTQYADYISQKSLIGIEALVISPILKDSFGTISYHVNGNTYTSPAKHIKGKAVAQNTVVVIDEIRDNIFFIKEKSKKNNKRGVYNVQ